jgi:hypothetical protein
MERKGADPMSKVDGDGLNQKPARTLTDDQMVTEKSLPRRSFLAVTRAVLVGGAAALVLGTKAIGQSQDPDKGNSQDKAQSQDPDKAKSQDPDKAKAQHPAKAKAKHPDKAKAQDPDKAKAQDPDKPKSQDPDKPKSN